MQTSFNGKALSCDTVRPMSAQSTPYIDQTLVVGPFQCNCRILVCPETGQAALVDPGDEASRIIHKLGQLPLPSHKKIQVKYLLHTHAHLDHIGGTREVCEHFRSLSPKDHEAKIAVHQGDEFIYQQLRMQGSLFGIQYNDPLPIDHYLQEGENLEVGKLKLSVIHTPGHSPGSVCLRLHEDSQLQVPETLFTGDTLFQGSVGRTDLWGGDQDLMFKNIKQRIFSLDDDTRVCPGHGPESKVGIEKRDNPFFA